MKSRNPKEKNGQGQPRDRKLGPVLKKLFKYRGVALALPVVAGSAILTTLNMAKLPAKVTLNLPALADGQIILKLMEMDKGTAVIVPVLVTAVCLLLMFCSRRQTYPWLVSLFSLVLPIVVLIAGMFPG